MLPDGALYACCVHRLSHVDLSHLPWVPLCPPVPVFPSSRQGLSVLVCSCHDWSHRKQFEKKQITPGINASCCRCACSNPNKVINAFCVYCQLVSSLQPINVFFFHFLFHFHVSISPFLFHVPMSVSPCLPVSMFLGFRKWKTELTENSNLWRACNLTAFTPCLTCLADYPFASRHKGPRFKSPGGYLCETGILLLALSRYIGDPDVIDH